jgi:uncharacterized repeat protein (TIGR01451 family)
MKSIFALTLFMASLLFFSQGAFAQVVCQPIYGGGQTCVTVGQISIRKLVSHPQTGTFVENLTINDPKFAPNQNVTFQIIITNSTGSTINRAVVKDVLPQFVNFVSGPGSFDQNTKTLTFEAVNLLPNESRSFTFQARVVAENQLPQDITCVVNQATFTADSMQAQDNAQLCIQKSVAVTKGGLPVAPPSKVTVTPPTGPEMLPLIGLLPAGIGGWFLRRFKGGAK